MLDLDGRDAGCGHTRAVLDRYVDAELAGCNARARFQGVAVHLERCPACRADHDGLIATTRRTTC
jgi:anti-sigma factor RsiW